MVEDEDLLLAVLNSAPVIDGTPTEQLTGEEVSRLAGQFGAVATATGVSYLRRTRDTLQRVIRNDTIAVDGLSAVLDDAVLVPRVTAGGVQWQLDLPADKQLAARTVLAWSRVLSELPGRLRPCANTECNLFLIDHSRPGTARWCSMATCGNRMKARAYAQRARQP